jgi:hypothetical protein
MSHVIPYYPMRPRYGPFLTVQGVCRKCIYRPKVDGDRVLLDLDSKTAWNRHGDAYSKAKHVPWDDLESLYDEIRPTARDVPRYVDIELLVKHKVRKNQAVLLDLPERDFTFEEFMLLLDEKYPIRSGTMISARPGVTLLPYYNPSHAETNVLVSWGDLRNRATAWMEEYKETTPFYEGMVAVAKDSHYQKQCVAPKIICDTWTKHRFSR